MGIKLCEKCREQNAGAAGRAVYLPRGRHRIADPAEVVELRKKGLTPAQIAAYAGVTEQRIGQILKREAV